jgi:type 1 fimbria pilin
MDIPFCKPRRARRIWTWLVLALAPCLVPLAASATCNYVENSAPVTVLAPFSGNVTVGRDVPVGTEIYRARIRSTAQVSFICDVNSTFAYQIRTTPHPLSSYAGAPFGGHVYDTNVPGVGVVAWVSGNRPMPISLNTIESNLIARVNVHDYFMSLIKTGDVGAGTITAADMPTLEYVIGSNNLSIQQGGAQGLVNIVSSTCTATDVEVDLGKHVLAELTGPGSVTTDVDASFTLSNCPAFFGYPNNFLNNGVGSSTQLANNTLSYRIDPTTAAVDASNGLFALQAGGATGMAIQLLDGALQPVALNTVRDSGLTLRDVQGASYTVPLRARYYQTAATPTPGIADGAVTVTLQYL